MKWCYDDNGNIYGVIVETDIP